MGLYTTPASRRVFTFLPSGFLPSRTLVAAGALFLVACPTTERCPSGQLWHPDEGVCRVPDGNDAGTDTGGTDEDASCSSSCTAPEVCDLASGDCVACNEDIDCSSTDRGAACVGHACVACDSHDDCPSLAAPECGADNECGPCTSEGACTGRTGTEVCGAGGACVECAAGDESACDPNVCDVEAGTCTDIGAGTVTQCMPCTSNRACGTGLSCVLQQFDEPPVDGTLVDVGYVCLPIAAAVCTAATAPFVNRQTLTDRSGTSAAVCGLGQSTCPAYLHYRITDCSSDDACGVADLDDGLCRAGSPDTVSGSACTTRCSAASDCDPGVGCSTGSPRYCCFGPSCT